MLLPDALVTRACKVLLEVKVWLPKLQLSWPIVFTATAHVAPLSKEISTVSPVMLTALSVPVIVCAAVLVIKSVLLTPVSAENATLLTVVLGPEDMLRVFVLLSVCVPPEPLLPASLLAILSVTEPVAPATLV